VLDKQQITSDLIEWMQDFVEKPNPLLNDWAPCPYARQARINKAIEIVFSEPLSLVLNVERSLPLLEDKDVVIVCFDHTLIDANTIEELVRVHNSLLMTRDYVILEDHPDNTEMLNGVRMNFGKCGLLLVQRLSKLSTASKQLKEKGYYNTWPEENYADVVAWREQ